jgi:hypothetical protein
VVNVMCVDLDPLAFIPHFASQLCIASKLVCSLREAMAGSLSVANLINSQLNYTLDTDIDTAAAEITS